MKKAVVIALMIVMGTAMASVTEAQTKRIAILPFAVNSSENINYIRDGIWDMLISRVTVSGKTDVLSKTSVVDAMGKGQGKELTQADVSAIGKRLNADYVVWGSITKIGDSLSLDGKLLDVASSQSPVTLFEQTRGMNEVIPKISDFSQRIRSHVTGEALVPAAAAVPAAAPPAAAAAAATGAAAATAKTEEVDIATGMRKGKTTYTGIINPDFITGAQALDRKNFWMSPKFGTEFKGIDVGDVNGDGLNETVIIDNNNVYVYQKKDHEFKLLKKIQGGTFETYLGVDIADVNGNGIPEIFVTSINRQTIDSFAIEYRNGNFEVIEKGIRFMIRAISSMGTTRVLGQILAAETVKQENPFINPIHHVVWEGGRYTLGEKIRVPVGLSVYGLTLENIEGKSLERVITYDDYDYLRIYEKTDKLLIHLQSVMGSSELIWKSDDQYGGSNNSFKPEYAAGTRNLVDVPDLIFMKQRILSYDLNKDGKKELIVVKNLSAMGRVLKNVPLFTSAEIYNLEWDGLGLAEVWRTKKINGYVADYQIKDFDNDGQDEILLALVLSVGPTIRTNSCLVAYKLMQPPQSQAQPQAR